MIVIDEIHKRFNSRDWQSKKNNDFANWCSTHRHHGFDVLFITQDMDKVEKQVRSLVEWSYVYKKANMFGSLVRNSYFRYAYSGDSVSGKELQRETRRYDKRVFNCYKSYVASDIQELDFQQHANILKHPVFYSIPVMLLIFLYMFFTKSSFATGDIFGTKKTLHKFETKPPVSAPARPVSSPVHQNPVSAVASAAVPALPCVNHSSSRGLAPAAPDGHNAFASLPSQHKPVLVIGSVSDGRKYHILLSDGRSLVSKKPLDVGSEYL